MAAQDQGELREVGQLLRNILVRGRMNQQQLADHLGVQQSNVSTWVQGKVPIPARHVITISTLTEMTNSEQLSLYRGDIHHGDPDTTTVRERLLTDTNLRPEDLEAILFVYDGAIARGN